MKKHLLLPLIAMTLTSHAWADIYKSVDAEGRVTYSNIKSKGASRLELDPDVNNITNDNKPKTSTNPSKRSAKPDNFPRVDANTQNQRDSKRKEILLNELEAEKQALEEANKAYAEGESNPEIYKTTSGKTFRNVPKFEEKMKALQANVDNHKKNIELLQKEIDSLR